MMKSANTWILQSGSALDVGCMHIFKNRTIDEEFRRYGYAVVNLLEAPQIDELTDIYRRHPPPEGELGFVASMLIDDHEYKRAVDTEIRNVLDPILADVMPDYRLFHASFATKKPRIRSGAVIFHQDPAFVDEHQHKFFTIWCPLVEVGPRNGWLGVVGGSHQFNQGFRGPGMPYPELRKLFRDQYVTFLPVRPGQVVFLHPRAFHCSPMNRTNEPRLVAAGTITSRTCDRFYYCHRSHDRGEHMIEVFEVEEDFFLHHVLGRRPTRGRLHSVICAPPEPLDAQRLFDTCATLVRKPTDSAIVNGFTP